MICEQCGGEMYSVVGRAVYSNDPTRGWTHWWWLCQRGHCDGSYPLPPPQVIAEMEKSRPGS